MNKELFILTIIMLGWKKLDSLTYYKNNIFVLVNKGYLLIQTNGKFYAFIKYQDMINWIYKHDRENVHIENNTVRL